ncbi:P-selectin glycoprotein ligand 1 [Esox lucius]|uniref:P-selectin glycoprotein ligand 1 n=1 Tax=Esox lucius TaxID=8010 RepID=UPI00057748E7|nr:P-selectin glycoprotein ligand 1 [Esox lucius]
MPPCQSVRGSNMSSYNMLSVVLPWILFLMASIRSENVTLPKDRDSNSSAPSLDSAEPTRQTPAEVTNSPTTRTSFILLSTNPSQLTPKIRSESSSTLRPSSTTGPSSTLRPSSTTGPSSTLRPSSTTGPSSTLRPGSTTGPSSTLRPSSTSASSSTTGPSSALGPISNSESSFTIGPSSTTGPSSTLGPSSNSESSSTLGPSSTSESSSTLGPSSTSKYSSTLEPSSTSEYFSTLGPSSTNESASTLGPSSPTGPSSTPGPTSTIDSSLTNETLPSTYLPISTSTNSTNSSLIPIPKMDREKFPISTTRTTSPAKEHLDPPGGGGLPCSPNRRSGLVSQCLIAIASLAALATFFMVSCIIICTKYNSRKHRYAVSSGNRGTEMVCISALLPDGCAPHGRPHVPRSNGALLHDTEMDSDEEGGDNLTLHSFLPENDQRPESRV